MGRSHPARRRVLCSGRALGRIHIVIERVIGDDVDDAAHNVEPKEGAAWTLNHFNLTDLAELHWHRAPGDVAVVIRISLTTIHQYQQPLGQGLIVSTDT